MENAAGETRGGLDTNALHLTGKGMVSKRYTQTVTVSSTAGDIFTFGGWAKAATVPLDSAPIGKNGTTLSFSYNDAGLRTEKTVNGSTRRYIWNSSQLMTDVGASDAFYFHYSSGGELIGYTYKTAEAETECILVKNQQGDVERVISADGTILASYTYDAWGNVLTSEGSLATSNPIRYRGYYFDTETGFYYVSSRYYDPEIGRFINSDDIDYLGADGSPLSYNLFAYCMNNPVNRFDVNGNWSMPNWLKVTVGAVALAGAIALTVATGGGAAAVAVGVAKVVGSVVLSTAVSAGAGYLNNGKQGAIDGACNGFMFGSLSALGGAAFKYAKVHSATTGSPNSMGKAGERMAGIDQSAKGPIQINGRTRIPDAMTDTTLTEVKNVKYISNTQQLRDFAAFANDTGRSLELWVRPTTRIAKTVIDAGWHINYLW